MRFDEDCEMEEKRTSRGAFTLIELLVVIAIISLLVSILLPSLQQARHLAKGVVCQTNLRSIGTSIMFYANDYDGYAPPAGRDYWGFPFWDQYLISFGGAMPGLFRCPVKSLDHLESWMVKWNEAWMRTIYGNDISTGKSYSANYVFIDSEYNQSPKTIRPRPKIDSVDYLDRKMMAQCYGEWASIQGTVDASGVFTSDFWERVNDGRVQFIHGNEDKMNFLMADSHVEVLTEAEVVGREDELFTAKPELPN